MNGMLHLRTCLYHPKERAIVFSGHVHLMDNDKIKVIVGLRKICREIEDLNGRSHQGHCQGCYGLIEELR